MICREIEELGAENLAPIIPLQKLRSKAGRMPTPQEIWSKSISDLAYL